MSPREAEQQDACDPLRVHALIVAAEDYGVHDPDEWNIPGPYASAASFRDWLTGRGVPPGNITFLACPIQESPDGLRDGHEATGEDAWRPLSAHALEKYLRRDLRELKTDLLWVYWAGHGITDSQQCHQLLLPPDISEEFRTLDVRALRDLLIAEKWGNDGSAGPARVAMVIDTCQNNPWSSVKPLPTLAISVRSDDMRSSARPYFVTFSCGPSEKSYTGRTHTNFAENLMPYLESSPFLLPRPHHMMECINQRFAALQGTQSQTPGYEIINWGAPTRLSTYYELTPTEAERELAGKFEHLLGDIDDRRQLLAELESRGLAITTDGGGRPPALEYVIATAGRVPHGLPTLLDLISSRRRDDEADRLPCGLGAANEWVHPNEYLTITEHETLLHLLGKNEAALRRVARLGHNWSEHLNGTTVTAQVVARNLEAVGAPFSTRLPLLLRFAALLAAFTETAPQDEKPGGQPGCGPLYAWWTGVAARLGYEPRLRQETQQNAAREASRLKQDPGGWLLVEVRMSDPEAAPGQQNRYRSRVWYFDVEGTRRQISSETEWTDWTNWQRSLVEAVADHLHENLGGVEFLLPQGQLELPVERVTVEQHQGRSNVTLGYIHPVVVRWSDRETTRGRPELWEHRWNRCAQTETGTWLVQDAARTDELQSGLAREHTCVELTGTDGDFGPALALCLQEGSPVIAWNRRVEDVRQLHNLGRIHSDAPADLPMAVHRWRRQGPDSGSDDVVLLWDNPERRAPRPRLRSPRRGNR